MSQLELNKGDQFIIAPDVSASMGQTDTPNGTSRLEYVKETLNTFVVEASKWDPDGPDLVIFGHQVRVHKGVTPEKARDIIAPLKPNEGSTDTAGAITAAWKLHRDGGHKQTVLFVFTDGEPNDEKKTFEVIAGITQELKDEHEFAISFLTVGQRSAGLEAFLAQLDNGIPGAKHDIVDVKRLEEVDFMAAFAGALHD